MQNNHNQHRLHDVQEVLSLIGGRWRGAVLASLCERPRRFNELKRELAPITPKTLTKELKLLEENHLVVRKVHTLSELSVLYELSEHGQTLNPLIDQLQAWAHTHQARQRQLSKQPLITPAETART